MKNKMHHKFCRNSKILHFLGINSEIYHYETCPGLPGRDFDRPGARGSASFISLVVSGVVFGSTIFVYSALNYKFSESIII